jgi:hypothetical protein
MQMKKLPGQRPLAYSYYREGGHVPAFPSAHRRPDWHHQHPPLKKLRLVGGKTLDEMWKKKTMWRRKLVMKGLGFSLAGVLYL